jgi:hypothetical protein
VPFTYESRGTTYYLYRSGNRYFFAKDPDLEYGELLDEVPEGLEVFVHHRSGLPMVRRIKPQDQEEEDQEEETSEQAEPLDEDAAASEGEESDELPPEYQDLIDAGWRPSKKRSRWYLQKWLNGTVKTKLIPRKYDKLIEQIASKLPPRPRKREVADEDWASEMRTTEERIARRKPFIQKELEHTAWFGNLILDIGHYAYQKLQRYVDWTEEDISNEILAKEKICRLIDVLIAIHENPGVVGELELENATLKSQLEVAQQGWMLEKVLKKAALERGEILLRHMDRDALEAATKEFMATGLLEFSPEMIQRISRSELETEA